MAFIANQTVVANQVQPTGNPRDTPQSSFNSENEFNAQELELLLGILREVTLKGYQVELFYNLIVKMQNQYIAKQNK